MMMLNEERATVDPPAKLAELGTHDDDDDDDDNSNGGFGVGLVQRVTLPLPSTDKISIHDKDLRNICSWLDTYDAKTLWIESGDDSAVKSMEGKELLLLCDSKDIRSIEDNKAYLKNDTFVQIKPDEGRYLGTHLPEAVIKHEEGNLETVKIELNVGEHGGKTIGNFLSLGLKRENDAEYLSDEKEGEVDNLVAKGKDKQLEEEDLEEVLERDDDDDEEEEYYLIEEIIEEGEEEEAGIAENEYEPTGKDLKEDEEHYQVAKKQCKRKEYEVFVGGLHRSATKEDIRNVFSQVGEVISIRMTMDRWSNKNRGYAFVQYRTVEQAKRALAELANPMVYGKSCDVTASRENDTLFVGNICKTWSQEMFEEKLKSYGVVNYKEVVLIQDNRYQGTNKGFAFVEFWSLAQATWAYVRLHKSHVDFGTDRAAKVSFAVFDKSDRDITFQAKTVFIDGVPPTWDEDWIRSCLQKYGFIESVKLARDMDAPRRIDFGYVTFDTHNSARRCIQGINASGLGKGHRKVKVDAQFCRPRKPRSRWNVRGSRDMSSRENSTHNSYFSRSLPEEERTPPHIPKRIAEISVPPARDYRLKRPLELDDRDQMFSVSKRPRRIVSFHRSHRRMPEELECCMKRSTREHIGAEYDSRHVIIEQRSSRNKYSYTSCEHVYSDHHSHSCNEYYRGPCDSPRCMEGGCCEVSKRMEYAPDMYEDRSSRRLKSHYDYDASSSRCAPCAKSSSRNRHELSDVAYGTGSGISYGDDTYRGSDDRSYYRGSHRSGEQHRPYISSSSSDRKYYSQRSDGFSNSYMSYQEHSSCCNSTSRECRDSYKRQSYRNY